MDRVVKKKKTVFTKPVLLVLLVVAGISLAFMVFSMDFSSTRVDRDSVLIEQVKRGRFNVKVSSNGLLKPKKIEWLASQVKGRVKQLHVRGGEYVKKGDLILEMENPELMISLEEVKDALEGGKSDFISYKISLNNEVLKQETVVVRAKYAYKRAELQLEAENSLISDGIMVIPEIDHRRTKLRVKELKESYKIEQKMLERIRNNVEVQLVARQANVNQLKNVMQRQQTKAGALNVYASMSGMVQESNLKIGQRLIIGSDIAKIARQDLLYAELKVLSNQARHLKLNQKVVLDLRSVEIEGLISRIDPVVDQGYVDVDVEFTGDLPHEAIPELRIEAAIEVADIKDTLFVGKPAYAKPDSTINVYKVTGNYATRTSIKIGKVSTNRVQVLSALEEGDTIIISDPKEWGGNEQVYLAN